jgi:deazaflavin-dependent oxidoreductase (nitroreductase family)
VIASNAGQDSHPGWFFNLRSDPRVRVEVGARAFEARARILEGEERAAAWSRVVSAAPGYGAYERRTQRIIPLVALQPVG